MRSLIGLLALVGCNDEQPVARGDFNSERVTATAQATVLFGNSTVEEFGTSVSTAGDLNGDGYDDVVVGAPDLAAGISGVGRVYTFHGSAAGVVTNAAATLSKGTAGFGYVVANAGDVDADGYDDVWVSHPTLTDGWVFLYFGSQGGLSSNDYDSLVGRTADTWYGWSVGFAGDNDADGYADAIVGTQNGYAEWIPGGPQGVSRSDAVVLEAGDLYVRVATAGDVNGDGYDDVIVASEARSTFPTGEFRIYLGSAWGIEDEPLTIVPGTPGENFAWSIAGVGDVNDDGFDDLVVGAPGADRAYWYLGSETGVSGYLTLAGVADEFGRSVSGPMDLNADGYSDFAVGSGSNSDRAFVYWGSSAGPSTVTALFSGTTGAFGWSVGGAGDVDGNGYDELLVGSPNYATQMGRVTLHRGYVDEDGDGVLALEDCDDFDAQVTGGTTWYRDVDADGFGGANSVVACTQSAGYVLATGDCDDARASVHPGATEVCDANERDEDCDQLSDDQDPTATGKVVYYIDGDGDFYGAGVAHSACDLPASSATTAGDCDDQTGTIHPGAVEVCDEADRDEDCDGLSDDLDAGVDAGTFQTWYVDADHDGYGTTSVGACDSGPDLAAVAGDCDDARGQVHPGAAEVCDPVDRDEDCDAAVDDGDPSATGKTRWYLDMDEDGYGVGPGVLACQAPLETSDELGDCDDADASVHPGATERCDAANTDEDCDGEADDDDSSTSNDSKVTVYADEDGDGYGDPETEHRVCDPVLGEVSDNADCDDAAEEIHPDATEVCNVEDDDCDGLVDEDLECEGTLDTEQALSQDPLQGCGCQNGATPASSGLALALAWLLKRRRNG